MYNDILHDVKHYEYRSSKVYLFREDRSQSCEAESGVAVNP